MIRLRGVADAGCSRECMRFMETPKMVDDIAGLRRILKENRIIAVVGLSGNWYRPSYFAAKYMQEHGYRVIPVNPKFDTIDGDRCYASIAAVPEPYDTLDVFRAPTFIAGIACGGWVIYRWRGSIGTLKAFAWAEIALGATLLGSIWFYELVPWWFTKLAENISRRPQSYPVYELLLSTSLIPF